MVSISWGNALHSSFLFVEFIKTMTYRTDNKIRRYVKGYGFMGFAKNLESKYGKKL